MFATLHGQAPLVIAHRGACGYLPEHTLEGYARAVELGADYIEPDLVSTRDGVLIARHEPNLKDTTDVAAHPEFAARKKTVLVDGVAEEGWFAADFTLAEIKTLRALQPRRYRPQQFNGQYLIPSFDEILELRARCSAACGRVIGVYPETKHPSWHQQLGLPLEAALLSALERCGLNRKGAPVVIQSFETGNLQALRGQTPVTLVLLVNARSQRADGSLVPEVPYDLVAAGTPRSYHELITPAGLAELRRFADGIGPWKPFILPSRVEGSGEGEAARRLLAPTRLLDDAHQAGLLVHAFTFRNEPQFLAADYHGDPLAEYRRFYQLGVDGVFSDFSDSALAARHL